MHPNDRDPYRGAAPVDSATAPPLAWTRWPARVVFLVAALPVALVAYAMAVEGGCGRGEPSQVLEALTLIAMAAPLTLLGVAATRAVRRLVLRRARTRHPALRVAAGLTALVPGLCVVAAQWALAGLFFVEYVFLHCLDIPAFGWHGC